MAALLKEVKVMFKIQNSGLFISYQL